MTTIDSSMPTQQLKRSFWLVFWAVLLIKLYLAAIVPITGDEAEYIYWGQHLSAGYYEHPPLIGWFLALWGHFGLSNIWIRLLQIIASNLIALCMYKALARIDAEKSLWVSILYLLSPVSLFDIAILTDTPLMIFSFLALFCLMQAETKQSESGTVPIYQPRYRYYILAGLSLGAAFLSKYLMFPIAVSVALYFLLLPKSISNRLLKFLIVLVCALPFLLQNLIWNYHHDWVNLLFNLDLRNEGDRFNPHFLIKYLGFILYLYSPVLIYFVLRYAKLLVTNAWNQMIVRAALLAGFTTLIFFGVLSLSKSIGLHWVFCGYAFLFMLLLALKAKQLKFLTKWMLVYSGLQLIIVVVVFNLPMSFWQKTKVYDTVNWFLNYENIYPVVKPYLDKGFILMTPSYAQSYQYVYRHRRQAAVWGLGSVNGRPDDFFSDFKTFNHKNVVIVSLMDPFYAKEFKPYFKSVTIEKKTMLASPYHLVIGYDFNYPAYRNTVLRQIYHKFYQNVPLLKYLPHQSEGFYQRKYDF